MPKRKTTMVVANNDDTPTSSVANATQMLDATHTTQMTAETDNATDLIYRLSVFYNNNPEYKTGLVEINVLMRLAHQEMQKFISRPHTQITKIYFDSDAPKVNMV